MSRAYLYMEHLETGELVTLGRLSLKGNTGEFLYAPDWVERGGWVPDPINYPLRAEPYIGIKKNRGIPGFINDAMPDGWGERLLHRAYGSDLGPIDFLLRSPNSDRIGNLMAGTTPVPTPGLGGETIPTLRGLTLLNADWNEPYHRDWCTRAWPMKCAGVVCLMRTCMNCSGACATTPWPEIAMITRATMPSFQSRASGAFHPCMTFCRCWKKVQPRRWPWRLEVKARTSVAPICSAITDTSRLSVSMPSICSKRSPTGKKSCRTITANGSKAKTCKWHTKPPARSEC
jgi:hypothetical protein